jgi:pyruvate dehydrogenase E2 component (dihydrolipoamide acetyltransferase)
MAISVVMPALEMAQETGKLVAWLKKEGEHVTRGEMLLEVETDKAVVEIEAQGDGVLAGITAQLGDVIPVGQTIAWLVQPGEEPPVATAPAQTGRKMDTPVSAAPAPSVGAAVAPAAGSGARISPRARRLAKEHGIDLSTVTGSGSGGEILAEDIVKIVESGGAAPAAPAATPMAIQPVSTVGRIMAERTTQSWTTVPHFFVARDVDGTSLNAARQLLIPAIEASHGVRVTHTDLLVALVARALARHPRLNSSWAGTGIAPNPSINIALAMAVDQAVVTAVIPDADRLALGDLALRRKELATRARANRLQPADINGATFTISNLGMFGVDAFTAIIVPPQAGILAVGAMSDRPVVIDGEVRVRPMMTLTLSSDHRVVDGAGAASFMKDLVELIHSAATALA